MENIIIESNQNKIIKEINALRTKKERDKTGLFVLEGQRLVEEIPPQWEIDCIVKAESYKGEISCDTVYTVKDSLFAKISDTVNPQGILALCKTKDFSLDTVDYDSKPLFVLLENVMDPGNMGTLIRTADAAGVDGIFLSKGCVDLYNPKVIRATMGSVFHLPIYRNVDMSALLDTFNEKGIISLGAHLKGNTTPYNLDLKKGCAIIIGNEANGLSDEISQKASNLVKIPMLGKAESMNAGIAGGILIYEAVRQRIEE